MSFDRRITPARPDLAAAHLRGQVEAEQYVEGQAMRVTLPAAPLRREPAPDMPYETEALAGEEVRVYEEMEGWAWVQLQRDGYVGWLSANALGPVDPAPTHRVVALRTLVYPGPGFKAEPVCALSIGAEVAVARSEGAWAATPLGFVHAAHLAPLGAHEADFVAVAEKLLGTPYLWGGKSSLGIDCSGLVQLSMALAGRAAPRDSDMQERGIGTLLPPGTNALERGDLVFWKGHVGIMRDADTLLHANAHHMAVASEPLAEAVARIEAKSFGAITSLRRPG